MNTRKIVNIAVRIVLPLFLGGAILWWMYRGFDWEQISQAVRQDMDWTWMWLSFPFGILAQWFRAMRWRMVLQPLGYAPRVHTVANSIFLSYASSLVIPRVGEVLRCGVLHKYEGVPFTQSVGTVVTERVVDMLLVLLLALFTFIMQIPVFQHFFQETGLNISTLLSRFTVAGYWVTAICAVLVLVLFAVILKRLAVFHRVKGIFSGLFQGLLSVFRLRRWPLYLFYSIAIWGAYYLHLALTFRCFESTSHLGSSVALVAFVVGCFAVLVPTPNGAGPWHFAVKTVLTLFGVAASQAVLFVLIVHTVQTLLVLGLGLYALVALQFTSVRKMT